MADQTQVVALEVAKRDLDDIKHLRENEHFRRYFLRRLNERADYYEDQLKHGEMTKEVREETRRIYNEYEYLAGMMDRDFASCAKNITAATQVDPPGTRGNG